MTALFMSPSLHLPLLLLAALAPLAGAISVGVWGTRLGGNWLGKRVCHGLAILGVLVSFLLSAWTLWVVSQTGERFEQTVYSWMEIGSLKMEVGFLVDGLTSLMMCVVTFVSLMVHIYTIGYMEEDEGYNRFFAYISLFTFAMLMLVMSNNLLQLFFGWEGVGLVSYLLIGFWFGKPTAVFANMKAFLVNRVGDFGFILGIGLIAAYTGSLNYTEIFEKSSELSGLFLPGTDWPLVGVVCLCLFVGAMGKSAQFPLHVWLPDSMEGPTPISALIHAATMVTAGIFMVSRMSPLFELSDTALNVVLVVGSITALFMGFLGIIQNDIKRVVAYSTLSQLGYMTVALGVSAYPIAIFHLMTHAFFKALLFLAAGSVIMGVHHNQDIRYMGGLKKYMPITWITSLVGSLALIGTPFFSGFYSKDSIIEAVFASDLPGSGFAKWAVMMGVFVTAFYSFRMYFLVFHGEERYHLLPQDESDHGAHATHTSLTSAPSDAHDPSPSEHAHTPHESPWVVTLPLVLLAIPSVFIGYLSIQSVLYRDFLGSAIQVLSEHHPVMHELASEFESPLAMALASFTSVPFGLALLGVLSAYYCYMINPRVPQWFASQLSLVVNVLENKYYMDWFNEQVIARLTRILGRFLWREGDQRVIDGFLVNGSWKVMAYASTRIKPLQTGYLYHYALVMIVGVFLLMTWFVWIKP
jgi:NADH-quinone oxidoreductase subunit L